MKISIDVQPLLSTKSGVGYYIAGLVKGLAQIDPDNQYRLSYFDFRRKGVPFNAISRNFKWVRNPLPGRCVNFIWKNIRKPYYSFFFGESDVYHFPNFIIRPLCQGRKVVTIHDLSFLRFPQFTEPKNLKFLKAQIEETVQTADAIIVDSAFTQSELFSFFKISPERVHVIHLGIDPQYQARRIEKDSTILFVGTLEPRKNIETLLSSFEIFMDRPGRKDFSLVLAGMKGWLYEGIFKKLERNRYRDKIKCLDYVSEETLQTLYHAASLFIYPSHYEGFGLPPLEAMASGLPVIAARRASLPEVLGNAAEWIEPEDAEGLALVMEKVLDDEGVRTDLIQKGFAQVKKFQWIDTAKKTLQVYRGEKGV